MNANFPNITETIPETGDNSIDDEDIIILTTNIQYEIMVKEMETNVMIDTACTETKSGKKQLLDFTVRVRDMALNKVQVILRKKAFRFFLKCKFRFPLATLSRSIVLFDKDFSYHLPCYYHPLL